MPRAPAADVWVVGGWTIYVHPLFQDAVDRLETAVARARRSDPDGWQGHAAAKVLRRLRDVIHEEIAVDPTHERFRLGNTLGPDHRGWSRAKFLGRFRLFFRYSVQRRIIILCWLNDETSLRKDGARTDPYATFRRMLLAGDPPSAWDVLLAAVEGRGTDDAASPRP